MRNRRPVQIATILSAAPVTAIRFASVVRCAVVRATMCGTRHGRLIRGIALILIAAVGLGVMFAQWGYFGGGQIHVAPGTRTAREIGTRSVGTPIWDNEPGFQGDVFTFARLRYDTAPRPPGARRGGWTTDL